MSEYNVKQISEMLNINPETVRRWIRNGKLDAKQASKKGGNVVSEEALKKFLEVTPKYAGLAAGIAVAATPVMGVPITVAAMMGGLISGLYSCKNNALTSMQIKEYIEKEITKSRKMLDQKEATLMQLHDEIEEGKKHIEEMTYLLNNADFQEMADSINGKNRMVML